MDHRYRCIRIVWPHLVVGWLGWCLPGMESSGAQFWTWLDRETCVDNISSALLQTKMTKYYMCYKVVDEKVFWVQSCQEQWCEHTNFSEQSWQRLRISCGNKSTCVSSQAQQEKWQLAFFCCNTAKLCKHSSMMLTVNWGSANISNELSLTVLSCLQGSHREIW